MGRVSRFKGVSLGQTLEGGEAVSHADTAPGVGEQTERKKQYKDPSQECSWGLRRWAGESCS